MIYANVLLALALFFNPAHARPLIRQAPLPPIDAKNLEPGCNEDNAPERMVHEDHLTIADGENGYVPCDNSNMGYRIRKAMLNLGKMLGMNGQNRWTSGVIGYNPYLFVLERMDLLEIRDKDDDACDPLTNGYYQGFKGLWRDKKVFKSVKICPTAKNSTDLGLMALMLHEARHADDKPHVNCTYGSFAMLPDNKACDPQFEGYDGSYGVTTEFYLTAAKTSTFTPAQRQEARSSAIYYLISRFNQLPKELKHVAILFPESGGATVFDQEKETKIISKIPDGYQITSKSSRPVFMSKTAMKSRTYMGTGDRMDEEKEQLLSLYPDIKNEFLDAADFGDMSCYLYVHSLICYAFKTGKSTRWNFQERLASRFMLVEAELTKSRRKGLVPYLVEMNGNTTVIPTSFAVLDKKGPFWEKDALSAEYAKNFRDTVTFPKVTNGPYRHLSLSKQGDALFFTTSKGQKGVVPGLTQFPYSRMVGPTVWSDALEKM